MGAEMLSDKALELCEQLEASVGDAFIELLQSLDYPHIEQTDSRVEITIESTAAYKRTLILEGISKFQTQSEYADIETQDLSYIEAEQCYSYNGRCVEWNDGESPEFDIRFKAVRVEVQVYNCTAGTFFTTEPWSMLSFCCCSLVAKAELGKEYINESEKELLPVMRELDQFYRYNVVCRFPILISIAERYGYDEVAKAFRLLDGKRAHGKEYNKLEPLAKNFLSKEKYSPMWRELWDKVCESQKGYPNEVELCVDAGKLSKARAEITKRLREHGYGGEYPYFTKIAPIKGLRLAESYGLTYTVGFKKRVKFSVYCREQGHPDSVSFMFVTGTDLRKTHGEDIYSCMFNTKGKTLSNSIACPDSKGELLKKRIDIAVKKAELRSLTKEEQLWCDNAAKPFNAFSFFMIIGGLFAVFFTLAMMGFACIDAAITSGKDAIPELFDSPTPWVVMFVLSWIGFGLPMTVLKARAKKK